MTVNCEKCMYCAVIHHFYGNQLHNSSNDTVIVQVFDKIHSFQLWPFDNYYSVLNAHTPDVVACKSGISMPRISWMGCI